MDLILSGYSGKMGQCLRSLFEHEKDIFVYDALKLPKNLSKACAWIDFSHTSLFDFVVSGVQGRACPLIMGTTGLSSAQMQALKHLSKTQVVVYDSNFSLGINAIKTILPILNLALCDFDVDIVEAHHKTKKDVPSGTAQLLQCILQERRKTPIPVLSRRAGGLRGEHTVSFVGQDEIVYIKHEVLDRCIFAKGVVHVVQWMMKKKPSQGFFNMQDILHDCIS